MNNRSRILIIDHTDDSRTALFKKIHDQLENIEIIACGSAKEAITATTRYEFDIITTSIELSDMNGYQLIDKIRHSPKNKDTAIFVVSGHDEAPITQDLNMDETKAVTAYFDRSDEHKSLVSFIADFLQKSDINTARIIYVDNSATSSAITSSMLKRQGFHFKHFKSSEQGLEYIQQDIEQHGACTYDLLISDILLSGTILGYDLVKTVRNQYKLDYLTLPILLLTPEPDENEKTDFTGIFGAGTNDFLTKPFSEDSLLDRIEVLINIKRQHEALHQ